MIEFKWERENDQIRLSSSISYLDWLDHADANQIDVLSLLDELLLDEDNGTVIKDGEYAISLSYDCVAMLSDEDAKAINLPDTCPYILDIRRQGILPSPGFEIWWTFSQDDSDLWLTREDIKGCFIDLGAGDFYRLPFAQYKIIQLINQYQDKDQYSDDLCLELVSEIKALLPEVDEGHLQCAPQIQKMSLKHARAFGLKVEVTGDEIEMAPVLFDREKLKESQDGKEIMEGEGLLEGQKASRFSELFGRHEETRRTYLLGSGDYVYIDPSIRKLLDLVRTKSRAGREEKIEFLHSPHKYIKEATGTEASEQLFIETSEFSDRVTGLGEWEENQLPWLPDESLEWSDDNYYFYIENKLVRIPKDALPDIVEKIRGAVERGDNSVDIYGTTVTADGEIADALEELLNAEPDDPAERPHPSVKIVPLKQENYEELVYRTRSKENRGSLPSANPSSILREHIRLKEHQREGLEWMVDAYNKRHNGILLADDMGLGKTLQTLAFLALLREAESVDSDCPVLIVAPLSLLENWKAEHGKFLRDSGLGGHATLHGTELHRFKKQGGARGRETDTGMSMLDLDELKKYDWLLTTYGTLRDYQISFAQIEFSCVVFDEIQNAKNPTTLISHAACILNSQFSIGLTGTPVENGMSELWNILDILSPGYIQMDLNSFVNTHTAENLHTLRKLADFLLEPNGALPPIILRRLKEEVLGDELPDISVTEIESTTRDMPKLQDEHYSQIQNKILSGEIDFLPGLQGFRRVSLHPVNPTSGDELEFNIDYQDMNDAEYIGHSARLVVAFKALDDIFERQEKALIFILNIRFQERMAALVKRRYKMKHKPLIINGRVSGKTRQMRVDDFQKKPEGFDAFIISPRAGGVGLNLTAANHVIHLERWWNPAVEDQCTSRAHRIGQTKPVRVVIPRARRLVRPDISFDLVLHQLLDRKRKLAREIFYPGNVQEDEFRELREAPVND
ncbi:MAG: DEAD/DEAH box helicase [Gammaproteobacteria bacterium AqS3]|nr:DEAD/DEAH box helicase [Gammaproteobacteria bacterium AqS3]